MKGQIMVDDRVVDMVSFQQMLECARSLVRRGLDIVDLDRGDVDSPRAGAPTEVQSGQAELEHCMRDSVVRLPAGELMLRLFAGKLLTRETSMTKGPDRDLSGNGVEL